MKKVVVGLIFVLFVVFASSVYADYDLSGISYTDLQNLVAQAQKEMMTRPEFQSVEVPVGLYVVGREIPAGQWTITMNQSWARVQTGSDLEDNQMEISYRSSGFWSEQLNKETPTRTITLIQGMYIEIREHSVIFSTPTAPSFSFK